MRTLIVCEIVHRHAQLSFLTVTALRQRWRKPRAIGGDPIRSHTRRGTRWEGFQGPDAQLRLDL